MIKKIILFSCLLLPPANALAHDKIMPDDFTARIRDLEHKDGGRMGIAALNTENGQHLEYKADEKFAFCSTFKLLLVADILSRIDAGSESMERLVSYGPADMQKYAPVTEKHLQEGKMTVADLSAAAIEYSDNTAANLLLKSIGGPQQLTAYVRSIGDSMSRLDRNEPALNANLPEDARDTTTPSAMLGTLQKLLVGNVLSPASKERLISWLIGNTTGDTRLRAGIDAAWKIGDKTGTGENGATNDVAIVWPPDHKPFLIAVYYSGSPLPQKKRNAVIAKIAHIVSAAFYAH